MGKLMDAWIDVGFPPPALLLVRIPPGESSLGRESGDDIEIQISIDMWVYIYIYIYGGGADVRIVEEASTT